MVFQHSGRLPHLATTEDYFSEPVYRRECQMLARDHWHLVGTSDELAQDGQFITRSIAGIEVQIRNFSGSVAALSNVCAHRHCLISSETSGCCASMRCQYHGWEYRSDGRSGRIPEPKNFSPIEKGQFDLPRYRVEYVGQLVFVHLGEPQESLSDFLGQEYYDFLWERFGDDWRVAWRWEPTYQANWKVPVENSLEAYHVPAVHPGTFKSDPGSSRSEHGIYDRRTWFRTSLPFSPHSRLDRAFQTLESRFVRWLGDSPSGMYEQHHVFPNVLFSFTDAISLCQVILPTAPNRSKARVIQMGRCPQRLGTFRKFAARAWARLTSQITRTVLLEDQQMFPAIQRGIEASPHQGVLGSCEERIHRFQQYMESQLKEIPA